RPFVGLLLLRGRQAIPIRTRKNRDRGIEAGEVPPIVQLAPAPFIPRAGASPSMPSLLLAAPSSERPVRSSASIEPPSTLVLMGTASLTPTPASSGPSPASSGPMPASSGPSPASPEPTPASWVGSGAQ